MLRHPCRWRVTLPRVVPRGHPGFRCAVDYGTDRHLTQEGCAWLLLGWQPAQQGACAVASRVGGMHFHRPCPWGAAVYQTACSPRHVHCAVCIYMTRRRRRARVVPAAYCNSGDCTHKSCIRGCHAQKLGRARQGWLAGLHALAPGVCWLWGATTRPPALAPVLSPARCWSCAAVHWSRIWWSCCKCGAGGGGGRGASRARLGTPAAQSYTTQHGALLMDGSTQT